jgi:hypothetical protein
MFKDTHDVVGFSISLSREFKTLADAVQYIDTETKDNDPRVVIETRVVAHSTSKEIQICST